jgi:transposase
MIRAYESSYAPDGDYGIPPEVLIRAKLLQALYSIKSERALCEQIEWNVAFRWFVGLDWDEDVFDHSTLSVNRARLFGDGAAEALLGETVRVAESKGLLNSDRLVVDGTLIKAWASHKSFKAKDGSDDDKPDFKGTRRSNDTHESTTDPDARLCRKGKGQESMLAYIGHVMVDAVTGIVRGCETTIASGKAEVQAALRIARTCAKAGAKIIADRNYDQTPFITGIRELGMIPHPRAKSSGSQLSPQVTSSASYDRRRVRMGQKRCRNAADEVTRSRESRNGLHASGCGKKHADHSQASALRGLSALEPTGNRISGHFEPKMGQNRTIAPSQIVRIRR